MDLPELNIDEPPPRKESYLWEAPGKPFAVAFDFDVVDRLNKEILRESGVLPGRGVETGGVLLGTADRDSNGKLVARVKDYEPAPCNHEGGPSYVLGEAGQQSFLEALARSLERGRGLQPIGFYRGHLREGLGLSEEDVALWTAHFVRDRSLVLLVKPQTSRAPLAGVFFDENGEVRRESSYREFPFRREELGGNPTLETPAPKRREEGSEMSMSLFSKQQDNARHNNGESNNESSGGSSSSVPTRSMRLRGGWVWIPLSFVFLLLGTVLGFQVALSVDSKVETGQQQDPYTLELSATPSAESVHLRWDRMAPAILRAQRGVLTITEDGSQKNVDLDAAHLRNGSVIYRRVAGNVQFRLEVFTKQKVSVSETLDYRTLTAGNASSSTPN